MQKHYSLRCTIYGHESDVRAICGVPNSNNILSVSRDKTARHFVEDLNENCYKQEQCFTGHENFVSSVIITNEIEGEPDGLIVTGANDNLIRCFTPNDTKSILEIPGHTNTVCSLAYSSNGIIASGSWDMSAKVWKIYKDSNLILQYKNIYSLTGHKAAVWSILFINDAIITASADKSIKVWRDGKCSRTITGHTDCVRGLSVLPNNQFLSCGNDATIKRWTLSGDCLHTYYGHTNFIYSVASFREGFVSCGEDRTLRVWSLISTNPIQTINLPAQSVWYVVVLTNGDIAVGLSDATIRVFTNEASRIASSEILAKFEVELANSQISKSGNDLGDVDTSKLPGKEALQTPGKKDGQTIMVRNGVVVEAHNWSMAENRWVKIGDVVGSSSQGKKMMYKDKEYDYVFDVDIQEGMPALKLPYNTNEDPWFAAQRFIDENELPQDYLDQIATFITDNSKNKQIGVSGGETSYDPFTGEGRYVPGDNSEAIDTGGDPFTSGGRYVPGQSFGDGNLSNGRDPFTGQGSYVPDGSDDNIHRSKTLVDPMINPSRYVPSEEDDNTKGGTVLKEDNKYFPKQGFLRFESSSPKVMDKVKEFSLQDKSLELSANEIISLEDFSSTLVDKLTINHFELLWRILKWPENIVLPALDLLRIGSIKRSDVCKFMCIESISHDGPTELLELITSYIQVEGEMKHVQSNRLVCLRTICNMFSSPEGAAFVCAGYDRIFTAINIMNRASKSLNKNKNVQIAVASVFVNFAVLIISSQSNTSSKVQILNKKILDACLEIVIAHLISGNSSIDSEAVFRYFVALGTLLSYCGANGVKRAYELGALAAVDVADAPANNIPKIQECANLLRKVIANVL